MIGQFLACDLWLMAYCRRPFKFTWSVLSVMIITHFYIDLISVQFTLFLIFRIRNRRRVSWAEIKVSLHWWKRAYTYFWITQHYSFLFREFFNCLPNSLPFKNSRKIKGCLSVQILQEWRSTAHQARTQWQCPIVKRFQEKVPLPQTERNDRDKTPSGSPLRKTCTRL